MSDPFNVEQHREAIDEHKAARLADPWRRGALKMNTQQTCISLWIEQMGDAELYRERWMELENE